MLGNESSSRSKSAWTLPLTVVGATIATIAVLALRPETKQPVTSRPPQGKCVVSHLTVQCRNLQLSLKFYKAMGFLEVSRTNDSILMSLPKGLRFAPYLLLQQSKDDISPNSTTDWQCTMAGYGRIAILVPSVAQASKHLKQTLGVESMAPPVTDTTTDRQGRPQAKITIGAWQDPDGTVVELVETHSATMRGFLSVMKTFGAFDYPLWIHCNINATNFEESYKAYQQLGFQAAFDFGRVKNKLYQSLGIPDPGIAKRVCMIKTAEDIFQVDLIEWEDPKTIIPKAGLRTLGLTKLAVVKPIAVADMTTSVNRIPVGWETNGDAQETILPEPLGQVKIKTLRDPDGATVEIIEFI